MRASADDEAAWSSAGTLNPALSYDEEFCIIDKGCGHVLRQLTASPEDVERLDALLREVSFDANVDEWLALLKSSEDTSDGDDAGGVTGATGVFDEDGDLVGFGSTVVYGTNTDAPFGWVGNIVVRSDYRKRGVASMVLRAALDSMGAATLAVLDASAMGAPLYLKAGFAPVAAVRRWTLSRDQARGISSSCASKNAGDVAAARREVVRGERQVPLHELPRANRRVSSPRSNVEAHRAEVQLATASVRDGVSHAVLHDAQLWDGIAPRPQRVPAAGAEHRGVHVGDERAVALGPVRGGVDGGDGGGDVARVFRSTAGRLSLIHI